MASGKRSAPGDIPPNMGTICWPLCCPPEEPVEWASAAGSCEEGVGRNCPRPQGHHPCCPLPVLARPSLPGARGSVHSLLAYGGESSPLCSQASPQQQLLSRSRRPPLRHTLSERTTEDGYCANGMEKRPFLSSERVLKTCIPRFACLFVCLFVSGQTLSPIQTPIWKQASFLSQKTSDPGTRRTS